jgi:hypothetical protein
LSVNIKEDILIEYLFKDNKEYSMSNDNCVRIFLPDDENGIIYALDFSKRNSSKILIELIKFKPGKDAKVVKSYLIKYSHILGIPINKTYRGYTKRLKYLHKICKNKKEEEELLKDLPKSIIREYNLKTLENDSITKRSNS